MIWTDGLLAGLGQWSKSIYSGGFRMLWKIENEKTVKSERGPPDKIEDGS